jgi:hypothetical protein
MYHECAIRLSNINHVKPVDRFIRITDVIDEEQTVADCPSLARYMYLLPLHPLTVTENEQLKGITDADQYCVSAATIVLCRLSREKYQRHKWTAKYMWDYAECAKNDSGLPLYSGDIQYLIAYIHNQLHDGPKVPIPVVQCI